MAGRILITVVKREISHFLFARSDLVNVFLDVRVLQSQMFALILAIQQKIVTPIPSVVSNRRLTFVIVLMALARATEAKCSIVNAYRE